MMDISTWICVALIGAFVAFPLATWLSSLYPSTTRLLRTWIIVPQIPRKIHLGSIGGRKTSVNLLAEGILTPLHLCVMLALFVPYTVILLSSYKIQRLLIWRTGRILAFTFSFLVISGRQSLFTNSLRISLNFQSFIHRWLGRIVFLCTVIHVVVAFVPNRSSVALLPLRSRIAGFTATSALFLILITSLSCFRQTHYEISRWCHHLMFAITMIAVILHLEPLKVSESAAILLIVATSMYVLLIGMRMRGFIFQRAFVIVHQGDGMLKVELQPLKPARIYPGQYVWLRISSKGYNYLPFTESHPFTIASWEKAQDGKAKSITFLIDPRKGFTRKLKQLVDDNTTNFSSYDSLVAMSKTDPRDHELQKKAKAESKRFKLAFFDGPYGQPIRAEEYGTVILYATGIGIGAQLAVVKHLLESRESGNAKTQRITLLWEVEHEFFVEEKSGAKRIIKDTAYTMVLDLLQQDSDRLSRLRVSPEKEFEYKSGWQGASPDQGYIFRCIRYIRNPQPRSVPTRLHNVPDTYHIPKDDSPGKTGSFDTLRIDLDPNSSLNDQLNDDNRRGTTLVSVCAYPGFARALRNVVARKGLHFHEHEFRPKKKSVLSVNV